MKIENLHGDMVHADSGKSRRLRRSSKRAGAASEPAVEAAREIANCRRVNLPRFTSLSILSIVSILGLLLLCRILNSKPVCFPAHSIQDLAKRPYSSSLKTRCTGSRFAARPPDAGQSPPTAAEIHDL